METILAEIFAELQKGASQVKHPFRYFCLSSVEGNIPKQRMVVFRGIHNNVISVYTDIRTSKILHFKKNPNASVLLYDYQNMKQIQLIGEVSIEEEYDSEVWNSISPKAQKDYTTILAPGIPILNPNTVQYNQKVNFCILKFTFSEIDYLKIETPFHIRSQFILENNQWKGNYVVP